MPDVIALGDLNIDIIAHFPGYPAKGGDAFASSTEIHCGGSAANAAIALARLGISTGLITRIGPDSWALNALHSLKSAGVDLGGLQRDLLTMTGLMYVVVTPDGERTILGCRGANVLTDPGQVREEYIRDARLFHLSGYALLSEPQRSAALLALEIACRHRLVTTLDPGMTISEAALDAMHALLPAINILLPNLKEAQKLSGQHSPEACIRALLDRGSSLVVLKLGRKGCVIGSRDGLVHVPGFHVETRDSTGAGDSFAAGLIAGILGGLGYHGAAVLGNALGALTAARVGNTPVERHEVVALLRKQGRPAGGRPCLRSRDAVQQALDLISSGDNEQEES
jgi:ribokinase